MQTGGKDESANQIERIMEMDFLDLQLDETNEIKNPNTMWDFPAVSFRKYKTNFIAHFNRHAGKLFNKCQHVKIYATAEYVVFLPIPKKDLRSYKITYISETSASVTCAGLERLRLDEKTFKLYNTEKGLAIKINDPIKNRKEQ